MMKVASYHLIGYISIFLLQGVFSDVDGDQWSFSFPSSVKVLKNSDVIIPCTFSAPSNRSEVNLIWYKYKRRGYPQVFNEEHPSDVLEEYRGRTSLVGNGTNSCALRIRDVTENEEFFPGISEEINSYNCNEEQMVRVKVTGCHEDSSCKDWNFEFPRYMEALKDSCVEIPCTFTRPAHAKDFNFFWYTKWGTIFNNKTRHAVDDKYRGRTSLTGKAENDCSIKIDRVEKTQEYFPGVNRDINPSVLSSRTVVVAVMENPPEPLIAGTQNMEENTRVNLTCSVNHSCPSSPPSLRWSLTGHQVLERHQDRPSEGKWTVRSTMIYTPSSTDDRTVLECAATFPNNKTFAKRIRLDIKYGPRDVNISVVGHKSPEDGDKVMLICTCQANPPVHNYTWYQMGPGGKLVQGFGNKISVRNTTMGKYMCAATNGMGMRESPVFTFAEQSEDGSVALYAGIGSAAGLVLIIALISLVCIFKRRRKTSVLKVNGVEKTEQEEIPMDDHLYGNISQQHKAAISRDSSSDSYSASPIYNNTDEEHTNIITGTEEEQTSDWDGIVYSVLELPEHGQGRYRSEASVGTEYATLRH